MKELSIEQKAARYDEAIAVINKCETDKYGCINGIKPSDIFSELKEEGEDDRIRKNCIHFLELQKSHHASTFEIDECISWLEKQGEQKPADRVEPKFEIGDLITNGVLVGKIDEIHELGYHAYFGGHYADVPDAENWHKWTIQDAKDGDVLCTKNKCCPFIYDKGRYNNGLAYYYAGIDVSGNLNIKSPHNMLANFGRLDNIRPATKEQRELLFQKMKEAGYDWDVEKKECKKIEQKPADTKKVAKGNDMEIPNSAWSEEDEEKRKNCICWLEKAREYFKKDENLIYENEWLIKCIDWLKSLKPQNKWKPSNAQMAAITWAVRKMKESACYDSELVSLYQDLKKLKDK